jgi:long-chain fatty acid transport protein
MKKALMLCFMMGVICSSTLVVAGSIDYLSNQSAEYLMTFSRTAATDSADIVSYNPAGTVFLPKDGLYLNANLQYLMKPYSENYQHTEYKQNEPSKIPSTFMVYKKDNFAAFFSITIPAGGGKLHWKSGNATTAGLIDATVASTLASLTPLGANGSGANTILDQSIYAKSVYEGYTAGIALKPSDMFSFSVAGRYLKVDRSASATVKFNMDAINDLAGGGVPFVGEETSVYLNDDFDYKANGIGWIVGFDLKPIKELTFGLRYESRTRLDFKYSTNGRTANVTGNGSLIIVPGTGGMNFNQVLALGLTNNLKGLDKDGAKLRYDLPAVLGLGVQYDVTPQWSVMSSSNLFFLKRGDWEGDEDNYKNGYEVSLATTYRVIPAVKLGFGGLRTISGADHDTPFKQENPALDSWTIGTGVTYSATPKVDLTLSGSRTQYDSDSELNTVYPAGGEVRFNKVVNNIAAAIQCRFGD